MDKLGKLVRVRTVDFVRDHIVRLEFEDGAVRQVDLSLLMRGSIFDELLADMHLFRRVAIHHGTLVWPNGADIDPDVLYYGLPPATMSEVPATRQSS